MTIRRTGRVAMSALVVVLGVLAACSRSSTSDDSLRRDLELAGSTSLELAPRSAGTQVVSAIEATPGAAPARGAAKVRVPSKTPVALKRVRQTSVASAPEQPREHASDAAETPAASSLPATPAPTPKPVPTPQRRGGYKSIGDVIRNAPFPINP
jgi:hypothetical protein